MWDCWNCDLLNWRDQKVQIEMVVLNFAKAFDTVRSFHTWYRYMYSPLRKGVPCITTVDLDPYLLGHLLMTGSFAYIKKWDKKRIRPGAPHWDLTNIWSHSAEFPLFRSFWFSEQFLCIWKKIIWGFISILKDIFALVNFWSRSAYFPPLPVFCLVCAFAENWLDWAQM